jgi:hypothetical protein
MLRDIEVSGVAACVLADGAKICGTSTNVSVLDSLHGLEHIQHTCTAEVSKTSEWLCEDLVRAIKIVGESITFVVLLDGASALPKICQSRA